MGQAILILPQKEIRHLVKAVGKFDNAEDRNFSKRQRAR